MITMLNCPKFDGCSAPICCLDPEWHKRSMLNEDKTCFYLLESVKEGAKQRFYDAQQGELYEAIVMATPAILSRHSRIKSKVESAAKSGSRMARKFNWGSYA